MSIATPYLLFLGDAPDQLAAKVAQGIVDWRPENCVAQFRLPGCGADLGLADMDIDQAVAAGAKTLVVGVANRGGIIAPEWLVVLEAALRAGLDVAAGLHNRLSDVTELAALSARLGRRLHDVRHPTVTLPIANGRPRAGKRILPVGTDCSCGKMYTALALEKEMRERGMRTDFRATGQTGILITGDGIAVDAVVADFISGAVEVLAPENDPEHWDVIEGQGSLFHPSFAGVTVGLTHGAQPDVLVLCHEPTRTHMRGLPHFALPELEECIDANLGIARLTNRNVRFAGVSVNTKHMETQQALDYLRDTGHRLGMPAVDPFRDGVSRIVDMLP